MHCVCGTCCSCLQLSQFVCCYSYMICHGSIWHSLVWDTPRPSSLFGRLRSLSTSTSLPLFAVFSRSPSSSASPSPSPCLGPEVNWSQGRHRRGIRLTCGTSSKPRQDRLQSASTTSPHPCCCVKPSWSPLGPGGITILPFGQDMGSSSRSYCLITPSCRYPPAISLTTR